jgi:hypothetical protein
MATGRPVAIFRDTDPTREKADATMTKTVYFNHGFSLRNAFGMIRAGSGGRVVIAASSKHGRLTPMVASCDLPLDEPEFDPSTDPDEYVGGLLANCLAAEADLFVPQRGLREVAVRIRLFEKAGIEVSLPADLETLDVIDDKLLFTRRIEGMGLPIATTTLATTGAELLQAVRALEDAGQRAIVKPPVGVFGSGFWIIDDIGVPYRMLSDESRRMPSAAIAYALDEAVTRGLEPRTLVCEMLPGTETSVDAVCQDGRTIAAVGRSKSRSNQLLSVEGPCVDLAREVIARFGLSGLVNVQMKERADGTQALLEINPRMSGGCMYTGVAGVNLPWISVALPLGLMEESEVPTPVGGALVAGVTEVMEIS